MLHRVALVRTAAAALAAMLVSFNAGSVAAQPLTAEQLRAYGAALQALDAGRLQDARYLAGQAQHALGIKVFRWLELLQPRSGTTFEEIAGFYEANPDWPALEVLLRRAEEAMSDQTDDGLVLSWFATRQPVSVDGAMRLGEALLRRGERQKAITLLRETWLNGTFGSRQEEDFLKRYSGLLTSNAHGQRLDRLVWEGKREEAQRMLPRVDAGQQALATARLQLAAQARNAPQALAKVPDKLKLDPGLLFERVRWYRRKGEEDKARELLLSAGNRLGRPDLWWQERAYAARTALSQSRPRDAYKIVSHHGISTDDAYAYTEAEWFSGWIALRFLNDPQGAMRHFTRVAETGRYPVTKARAAYWAGRAAEATNTPKLARQWYLQGAAYLTTYYGQLAWARLEAADRSPWPKTPKPTAAERTAFDHHELVQVTRFLSELGQSERIKPFLLRLVSTARSPAQIGMVGELTESLRRPDLGVSVAKRAAQQGVLLPEHGYPVLSVSSGDTPERPLVLATIRQESAFEADAVSRVGARGLMQLMPGTAKGVARQLGLSPDIGLLTRDPQHNVRLGSAYLGGLLDDFDGSYVLAIASYNAGPGRARAWIRDNGDPRRADVDVVDWIEQIPIDETRNYVQRVLENLQVYRQRLGGTQLAETLERDLRRGR